MFRGAFAKGLVGKGFQVFLVVDFCFVIEPSSIQGAFKEGVRYRSRERGNVRFRAGV